METLKHYTGNKKVDGLWQWIVNRIPPHTLYYELYAGSATIARMLPPTAHKILVDINPRTVQLLQKELGSSTVECICAPSVQILSSVADRSSTGRNDCTDHGEHSGGTDNNICTGRPGPVQIKTSVPSGTVPTDRNNYTSSHLGVQPDISVPAASIFIYLDPPYRFFSRRGKRRLYEYELTDPEHRELLQCLSTVKSNCMISHPDDPMYNKYLKGWTKEKFTVSYHGKPAEECIYYNYSKPTQLQTYDFVGSDCWDRQRVKRKIERLARKLADLPALERNAVIARAIR